MDAIPITNKIIEEIRPFFKNYRKNEHILHHDKSRVIEVIKNYEKMHGWVDIITLSSNLLFSMNYVMSVEKLEKETFYNKLRLSPYDATGYLDGVEIVSEDYKQLFNRYKDSSNVVYLVDPPYLSTDTSTYNSNAYWKLSDYLDVLNTITGDKYIYFTSNKSHIIDLCNWIENRTFTANPFNNASIDTVNVSTSHNAKYTDMIVYKYVVK